MTNTTTQQQKAISLEQARARQQELTLNALAINKGLRKAVADAKRKLRAQRRAE